MKNLTALKHWTKVCGLPKTERRLQYELWLSRRRNGVARNRQLHESIVILDDHLVLN